MNHLMKTIRRKLLLLHMDLYAFRVRHSKRMRHNIYVKVLDLYRNVDTERYMGLCSSLQDVQSNEQKLDYYQLHDLKEIVDQREQPYVYWWTTEPYEGARKRIQVLKNAIERTRPGSLGKQD